MIYTQEIRYAWVSKVETNQYGASGTVATSRKKQDGTYAKSFWNAKFKIAPVEGKISIQKAYMTKEKANNGKYYDTLHVLEYTQDQDFTPIDESDDLPFN